MKIEIEDQNDLRVKNEERTQWRTTMNECKLDNESVGCNKLGQSCQTSLTSVTDISEGNKYSF